MAKILRPPVDPDARRVLDQVLRLWAERGGSLEPNDFIYLGTELTEYGPLHTFKHRATRRCLILDKGGHAYHFTGGRRCWYQRNNLQNALKRLY